MRVRRSTPDAIQGTASSDLKSRSLAEEPLRISKHQVVDRISAVPAPAQFDRRARHGKRDRVTPITSAVHPDPLSVTMLDEVDRSRGIDLRLRIQGDASPEPRIQNQVDRVLFDV